MQKLKELENESIRLEMKITNLKDEKGHILGEVVEAERQILLWERKIQLEKEMQDALDPTIGQTEIVAMRKEIHRMQLQYELFRKEQEKLIKDMERSVFKRETIQLKYLPKVEKKNAQDRCKCGRYFQLKITFNSFYSIPRQIVEADCEPEINIETHHGEHNAA